LKLHALDMMVPTVLLLVVLWTPSLQAECPGQTFPGGTTR
jgi:hypothetical protein